MKKTFDFQQKKNLINNKFTQNKNKIIAKKIICIFLIFP